MRTVPTNISTSTNQLILNYNESTPVNNNQSVEAKKPLPRAPAEMLHISPISGGTAWTEETAYTHVDPSPYYQPYYYPQQNYQPYYHPQPYYNHQQTHLPSALPNESKQIAGGFEWKMATKQNPNNILQRSDSIKIETTVSPSPPSHLPASSRFLNTLETHMEKPYEPPLEEKKQKLHKKISKLELEESTSEEEEEEEEEDSGTPEVEKKDFFRHTNSSSTSAPHVPSPGASMKRSLSSDPLPELCRHKLSIASCSLINDKSNIKLYRRMAIKTRSTETQLAYAKYLIQISKLYQTPSFKNQQQEQHVESPSQIRHRLLLEAGYWIERLAKSGSPEALFIQGRWYMLGPQAEDCVIYPKVQETKALHCFMRASRGGWADAHYELANVWKKKGNLKRAVYYYDIGAKDNHTPSIYKMAKIMLRGQLKVAKDVNKGLDYLLKAANMNDPASAEPAFVAACLYANELHRIGVDRHVDNKPIDALISVEGETNDSIALKYLRKSARLGCVDAIYFMGQVFEKGMLGQTIDRWQAYQYYLKAAEINHPEAMFELSQTYLRGIPELLSPQKDFAFRWCKRSADLGFNRAEFTLGQYYEDGVGVIPNFPLALEYYGKAASKGFLPAAGKLNRPVANGKLEQTSSSGEQTLKNNLQTKSNRSEQSQRNSCFIQ